MPSHSLGGSLKLGSHVWRLSVVGASLRWTAHYTTSLLKLCSFVWALLSGMGGTRRMTLHHTRSEVLAIHSSSCASSRASMAPRSPSRITWHHWSQPCPHISNTTHVYREITPMPIYHSCLDMTPAEMTPMHCCHLVADVTTVS